MKQYLWPSTGVISLFVSLLLMTSSAEAGWLMVEKDGAKTLFSKGMVKALPSKDAPMWFVMNADKGTMTTVSDRQKIFASGTPESYCKGAEAMQKQMMANMPPEYRKMIEQMKNKGGKKQAPKVSIAKMGSGGKIAGFKTTKYSVEVNGRPHSYVWLTTDSAIMKEMNRYRSKMVEMGAKMESCMSSMDDGMDPDPADTPEYMKMEEGGFMLKVVEGGETTMEVVKLTRKKVSGNEFTVPKGYKKVSYSEMMLGMMGGMMGQ